MKIDGKYTSAVIYTEDAEETCLEQIRQMVNNEQFTNPVAIMPDCHAGYGSVIGFTMKLGDRLAPNVVGVDIGCGMLAVNLGKEEHIKQVVGTPELDHAIRREIPMGFHVRKEGRDWMLMRPFKDAVLEVCSRIGNKSGGGVNVNRVLLSVGSLGGGNHFIEFAKSVLYDDIWLIIHSGSRNLGKQVCDYWQKKARSDGPDREEYNREVERIKVECNGEEIGKRIEELKANRPEMDRNLEWLEGDALEGYLKDMVVAQRFAQENRQAIACFIASIMGIPLVCGEWVESVHNYINFEDSVIRKGAIQAKAGQRAVVPLNMRDGTLLVEGKGNPDWNYSAPHGAGRVLSRTAAKAKIPMEDFKKSMEGIFSQSVVESTLDEAPMAYKDSKVIEAAIEPTATVVDRLIPLHNLKAT